MFNLLRRLAVLLAAASVSACVAGQSIDFKYQPEAAGMAAAGATVAVQVEDARPFVVNKDKREAYIGHYRAGFGNTWDVTTLNDRPLRDVLKDDISADLKSQGYSVAGPGQPGAGLLRVIVRDWNFDTYLNGDFWYELAVEATRPNGPQPVMRVVKDRVHIKGDVLTGARFAFERELPKHYSALLRRFLREDAEIQATLKGR